MSAKLEKYNKENTELKNHIKDLHQQIHILDQSNAFLKRQNASTLQNYQNTLKEIAELKKSNRSKRKMHRISNGNFEENSSENNE